MWRPERYVGTADIGSDNIAVTQNVFLFTICYINASVEAFIATAEVNDFSCYKYTIVTCSRYQNSKPTLGNPYTITMNK